MLLSVLLLAAGATMAVVTYLRGPAPENVVRSYFAALRAGDAPDALRYGRELPGDRRFLTSSVLRAQQRLAAVSAATIMASSRHGNVATVSITYSIGPPDKAHDGAADDAKIVREDVGLHLVSRHWLIDTPAASVRIDAGNGARRATMAGLALPTAAVLLFPGAVPVTYDTDLLEQDPTSDRIQLTSAGTLSVVAKLTDAGRQTIVDSVKSAMTRCLALGAKAPATCPLAPGVDRVVPGSLRGKLAELTLSGEPAIISGDADGLVQVDGNLTVDGSWSTLDFNNIAVARTGQATVPITAQTYVAAPSTIAWVAQ